MDEKKEAQGGAAGGGSKNSDGSNNKGKQRKIIFAAVIAVLLAVIGVLVYMLLSSEPEEVVVVTRDPLTPMGGRSVVLDQENLEEVMRDFNTPSADDSYIVSMSTTWEFESASSPSTGAIVNNLDINSRTICYDVYIKDTWELVYCSPYMPLGTTNAGFALDKKDLPPGEYDAVVIFFLVDDDYEVVTDLSVSVKIIIKS